MLRATALLAMLAPLAWGEACDDPPAEPQGGLTARFVDVPLTAPTPAPAPSSGAAPLPLITLADLGALPFVAPPQELGSLEPGSGDDCTPDDPPPDPEPEPEPEPMLSCGAMVSSRSCGGATLASSIILLNANACRDWCAATNYPSGKCCGFVLLGTQCKLTSGSRSGALLPTNMAATCSYQ